MFSVERGLEKSTLGEGSARRRSSMADGLCAAAAAPASSALIEARVGYGVPALGGLVGPDAGPRERGRLVMTGGRVRVKAGPCSPAGRPGRGVSRNISGVSVAAVDGRDEKACERAVQSGSSCAGRRLEPGIPGPASWLGGRLDLTKSSAR